MRSALCAATPMISSALTLRSCRGESAHQRQTTLAAEFAVLTGLRMRAITGLTWDRVDLRAKRAWVPKSGMKGGFTFGLPLNRDALRVLRKCKKLFPTGERVFQYEDIKARAAPDGA